MYEMIWLFMGQYWEKLGNFLFLHLVTLVRGPVSLTDKTKIVNFFEWDSPSPSPSNKLCNHKVTQSRCPNFGSNERNLNYMSSNA